MKIDVCCNTDDRGKSCWAKEVGYEGLYSVRFYVDEIFRVGIIIVY